MKSFIKYTCIHRLGKNYNIKDQILKIVVIFKTNNNEK